MPATGFNGRALTFSWAGTIVKGTKTKTGSISREAVDITSDDASGWRTYLAEPGVKSLEMSVEGITGDETLVAAIMTASSYTLPTGILTLGTGGTLTGTFFLSEMELTGEHDGAYEFSATMLSSGAVTFVADT